MKFYGDLPSVVLQFLEEAEQKRAARNELIQYTMSGVDAFYREREFYTTHIKECSIFMRELSESLENLFETVGRKESEDAVFDCCFILFEALCSIFREASLIRGHRTDAENRLLAYFEGSGQWLSSDMTIVAEMYFRTLPTKYASH